jgi:hypothetical protein
MSGQGTISVVIKAPAGFTSGTVKVLAKNCKGNSGTRTKNVTGAATAPTFQNGGDDNKTVGVCAGSHHDYEVAFMAAATSFTWSGPAGSIVSDKKGHTGNPLTVVGTDPYGEYEVTITFPGGFTSGNVTVYANSLCGPGPAVTLAVRSTPLQPGTISGPSPVCKHSYQYYSIPAVAGATSYTWTATNGVSIYSGQGTTTARLKFYNATSSSTVVSVKANNSCGSSAVRTKTVSINTSCKVAADGSEVTEAIALTSFTAYPNPTSGKATITFDSDRDAKYSLKVVDMIGRVMISENVSAVEGFNSKEINLENVAKGIYLISVQTEGDEAQTLRLIVE